MKSYGIYTIREFYPGYYRLSPESIEFMEKEADELFRSLNYVQACEKYYKVMEEIVKILATCLSVDVLKTVVERLNKGQTPWISHLLEVAVDQIVERLGLKDTKNIEDSFRNGWQAAVNLHRRCFHELELTPEGIAHEIAKVKKAIAYAKSVLDHLNFPVKTIYK